MVLRPFELSDAPHVQRLAGVRDIADTTLHIPHPYPDGAAAEWIKTHGLAWERGAGVTFAVTLRDTTALIGAIGLAVAQHSSWDELGYWVAVPNWNRVDCESNSARGYRGSFVTGLWLFHRSHVDLGKNWSLVPCRD